MLYTISIAVLDNLECTRKCLELIDAHTDSEYEIIISDNGSKDGTAKFLSQYSHSHSNCRIITYPYNTGFGYPHNQALRLARGEYFVVLNNDIFINESSWLEKLTRPFLEDPMLAIVGLAGNNSAFDDNGGTYKDPAKIEYVEASCLMIPRQLADTYGLFAEEYELAYWEDCDLSLRYRQMGMHIQVVQCEYEHLSNTTSVKIDPVLLQKVGLRNRKTFVKKWDGYLKRRCFTGRILIRAVADELDSLLAVTTVLHKLRSSHPLVKFDVITSRHELFKDNPAVNRLLPDQQSDASAYDRIINFDFAMVPTDLPVVIALADQAAVTVNRLAPVLFASERIVNKNILPNNRYVVVVDFFENQDESLDLSVMIQQAGYDLVVLTLNDDCESYRIGTRGTCSLDEMMTVVGSSELLIGRAGVALKVAQAFSIPTITLFKAGEDAFVLGVDAIRSRWVNLESGCMAQLHDILQKAWFGTSMEVDYLQSTLLTRISQYDVLWTLYRDLKEQWQHLDLIYAKSREQLTEQEEHFTREIAEMKRSFERSLSWRITSPLRKALELLRHICKKLSLG